MNMKATLKLATNIAGISRLSNKTIPTFTHNALYCSSQVHPTKTPLETHKPKPTLYSFSPGFKLSSHQFSTASTASDNAGGTTESAPPPPESSESAETQKLMAQIEEGKKTVAEAQDKYLRALADNQNTINRMRKQVDDAKIYGIQGLVKDLLEFSDVLHSALESIPKEQITDGNMHLKNIHIGLTMVSSSLEKVYKKYGVQCIDPLGEQFNPNFHEALFQQEVENKTAGTVVAVSKVGYKLNDRVLRPALVGVAK